LGPSNSEPLLLSLAAQLEADLRWHERWPEPIATNSPAA
jgi:amidase